MNVKRLLLVFVFALTFVACENEQLPIEEAEIEKSPQERLLEQKQSRLRKCLVHLDKKDLLSMAKNKRLKKCVLDEDKAIGVCGLKIPFKEKINDLMSEKMAKDHSCKKYSKENIVDILKAAINHSEDPCELNEIDFDKLENIESCLAILKQFQNQQDDNEGPSDSEAINQDDLDEIDQDQNQDDNKKDEDEIIKKYWDGQDDDLIDEKEDDQENKDKLDKLKNV